MWWWCGVVFFTDYKTTLEKWFCFVLGCGNIMEHLLILHNYNDLNEHLNPLNSILQLSTVEIFNSKQMCPQ